MDYILTNQMPLIPWHVFILTALCMAVRPQVPVSSELTAIGAAPQAAWSSLTGVYSQALWTPHLLPGPATFPLLPLECQTPLLTTKKFGGQKKAKIRTESPHRPTSLRQSPTGSTGGRPGTGARQSVRRPWARSLCGQPGSLPDPGPETSCLRPQFPHLENGDDHGRHSGCQGRHKMTSPRH